jgi:hypothetical protein
MPGLSKRGQRYTCSKQLKIKLTNKLITIMATMSFKPQVNNLPTIEAEPVSSEIVPSAAKPVSVLPQQGSNDVQGEVSMRDIQLPRINIVQKVGELGNAFPAGGITFIKEVLLTDGKSPIDVTFLRLKKQYQEYIPYGTQQQTPKTFDTLAEVIEAGGQTGAYDEPNRYDEIAHIQVAIPSPADAPEEIGAMFPYEYKGVNYAVAVWTVKSSGYTAAAKPLLTARGQQLRNGFATGHWSLSTELKKTAKHSWYAPKLTFAGMHNEEASTFFAGLI